MRLLRKFFARSLVSGTPIQAQKVDFADELGPHDKIRKMRAMIEEYTSDPRLTEVAVDICREYQVTPRDHTGQAAAMLDWVQKNIDYIDDGVQTFRDPIYTMQHQFGNCANVSILYACLCESIAIPTLLEVLEKKTVLFYRDPFHVYVLVGLPARNPQAWVPAEATMKVPLGWDPAVFAEENADAL